jgi:predicted MFS family arabinose efflux permease
VTTATDAEPAASAPAALSPGYVRYALWILLVVYILNFLDRQIVTILAEPIRRELGLSDTQLGLLGGLAFALFYTVLGIPIARYADNPRTNRVGVIAAALAIWSGMTALCGMAATYAHLLLARIGVGVGEAGCTPPAHSLIADYVPKEKRASAVAFYGLGIPIGSLMGLVIGGWLNDQFGWRMAFFLVGAPGLLLALVVLFTLREPRKMRAALSQTRAPDAAPLGEALREIAQSKAFMLMAIAASFVAFLGYGKAFWAAALFQRVHGLSSTDTGLWLGLVTGAAGIAGVWLGGYVGDRFAKRDPRHYLTAPAIGMAVTAPILTLGYLSTDWMLALALLFIPTIANNLYYGPVFACVQGLVSPRTRATAAAVMLFIINLIGLGLGPLVFGMISDLLRPQFGIDSIRYVLVGAAMMGVAPAYFFWRASLHLGRELKPG